jgi:hypothetical protein
MVIGNEGEMWIKTNRTKTEVAANVPLLPQAMTIINKNKSHEYVFLPDASC